MLSRAQRGDVVAQTAVLEALGPGLAGLVRRLSPRADADDTLQELFLHLIKVLPKFDQNGVAPLRTWAVSVAHRFMLMQHRSRPPAHQSLDDALDIPADTIDADRALDARAANRRLFHHLALISDERRRVFVLAHLYGQSLDQIAEVEQVPVGTVKSRLHRARAELLLRLGPDLDFLKGGDRALTR